MMSILDQNNNNYLISHEHFINETYKEIGAKINPCLFEISVPYKRQRVNSTGLSEETLLVQQNYEEFLQQISTKNLLTSSCGESSNNKKAILCAGNIYKQSGQQPVSNSFGENSHGSSVQAVNGAQYVFPKKCKFYCKNINEIEVCLQDEQFDVIVMDPPWWNKYIRRKRKAGSDDAYDMLQNDELRKIPVEKLLKPGGLLFVWCTNAPSHIDCLQRHIFPKWQVQSIATWYWLKVTKSGQPVTPFSIGNCKQPYERIIIGSKGGHSLVTHRILVSIPSAIHSHKPPLCHLLKEFLGENAACLEIFARYLLPNWTSYGWEALRLQHESLFVFN